jgi:hypothetical protein
VPGSVSKSTMIISRVNYRSNNGRMITRFVKMMIMLLPLLLMKINVDGFLWCIKTNAREKKIIMISQGKLPHKTYCELRLQHLKTIAVN